ncbi:hypothetical protein MIR68_007835 [Amoeboaphelidium protococcarum]|nr:hypothetical protein MIR68_007835 [Amoeboaphelidium protococcarum]
MSSTIISYSTASERYTPKPPQRGSFPLDKNGLCKDLAQKYMKCIKKNKGSIEKCRDISKEYLQCRMDRKLMEPDQFENLGLTAEQEQPQSS